MKKPWTMNALFADSKETAIWGHKVGTHNLLCKQMCLSSNTNSMRILQTNPDPSADFYTFTGAFTSQAIYSSRSGVPKSKELFSRARWR